MKVTYCHGYRYSWGVQSNWTPGKMRRDGHARASSPHERACRYKVSRIGRGDPRGLTGIGCGLPVIHLDRNDATWRLIWRLYVKYHALSPFYEHQILESRKAFLSR